MAERDYEKYLLDCQNEDGQALDFLEWLRMSYLGLKVSARGRETAIAEAVAAEREACAKIAEEYMHKKLHPDCDCAYCFSGEMIAAVIRKRGE